MTITTADIKHGIELGIIRFTADPNDASTGTVCTIGDNWFYFGGLTAEETLPEDYIDMVGIDDAVREVKETLDEIKMEDFDEYLYYFAFINEALSQAVTDEVLQQTAEGNTMSENYDRKVKAIAKLLKEEFKSIYCDIPADKGHPAQRFHSQVELSDGSAQRIAKKILNSIWPSPPA